MSEQQEMQERRDYVRGFIDRLEAAETQKAIRDLYREAFASRILQLVIDQAGRTVETLLLARREPVEAPARITIAGALRRDAALERRQSA